MRTDLSTAFLAELSVSGRTPIQYLVFHFAAGDEYVSDRAYEYSTGLYCQALVQNWGNIGDTQDVTAAVKGDGLPTRQGTVTLLNFSPDQFSAKFNDESPENIEVDYYQILDGVSWTVLIDTFLIQDPISYAESDYLLSMDLLSANQYANPYSGVLDPDTNRFYGTFLGSDNAVPGYLYGDNPIAKLADDSETTDTVLTCDRDLLAAGFTFPGSITIDFDTISYTGIVGNTFTGVGGMTCYHDAGQYVLKHLHDYVFAFGAGPVADMGPVYVNGIEYTGAYVIDKTSNPVTVTFTDGLPYETTALEYEPDVDVEECLDTNNITVFNSTYPDLQTAGLINAGGAANQCNCSQGAADVYIYGQTVDALVPMSNPAASLPGTTVIPDTAVIVSGSASVGYWLGRNGSAGDPTNFTLLDGALCGIGYSFSSQYEDSSVPGPTIHEETGLTKAQLEQACTATLSIKGWVGTYNVIRAYLYCLKREFTYKVPIPCSVQKINYVDPDCSISSGDSGTSWGGGSIGQNPADAIAYEFTVMKSDVSLNAAAFQVAWTWYDINGYEFTGFIPGETRIRQVIKDMCFQARGRIVYNGGEIFLYVRQPISAKTSVFTADTSNTKKRSISVTNQPVSDIVNQITAIYNKESWDGDYLSRYSPAQDATSVAKYGLYDAIHEYSLIRDSTMARSVADFWLNRGKTPYTLATMSLYLSAFPLELGDAITLETPFSKMYSFVGDIVAINRMMGSLLTNEINLFETTIKATTWDDTPPVPTTEIEIEIISGDFAQIYLAENPPYVTAYVEWGDGNEDVSSSFPMNHTYASSGYYKITANFTNITSIYFVAFQGHMGGTFPDLTEWTGLEEIDAFPAKFTDIVLPTLPALHTMTFRDNTTLTELPDMSGLTNSGDALTIGFTDCTSMETFAGGMPPNAAAGSIFHFGGCILTQAAVDAVLVEADTLLYSNLSIYLVNASATNSPPSSTGLAAKASLEGRGCTVYVNT